MRKILSTLFLLFFLFSIVLTVSAQSANASIDDRANLLTAEQRSALSVKAEEVAKAYQTDICILTVHSIGSKSSQQYADDYFDALDLGFGDDRSGILLLISMEDRDWAVTTNGQTSRIISYSDIGNIMDASLPALSGGNYYEAFNTYLSEVEQELQLGVTGLSTPVKLLIALGSGLLVAGIVLLILRSKMKTAKAQHGARSYINDSSYDLFRCHDIYLYSHTTKVRKQQNTGSSGGGSRGGRSGKF